MKESYIPYDSANYLSCEEEIAAYVTSCAEENDPALMAHAFGVVARARNMSELARNVGLTRAGLYRALSAGGNPSFATIASVANELGFTIAFHPIDRCEEPAVKSRPRTASKKPGLAVAVAVSAKRRRPAPPSGKRSAG